MTALAHRKSIAKLLNQIEEANKRDVREYAVGHLNESKAIKNSERLLPQRISLDGESPRVSKKAARKSMSTSQSFNAMTDQVIDSIAAFSLGTAGPLHATCRFEAEEKIKKRLCGSIEDDRNSAMSNDIDDEAHEMVPPRPIILPPLTKKEKYASLKEQQSNCNRKGARYSANIRNLLARFEAELAEYPEPGQWSERRDVAAKHFESLIRNSNVLASQLRINCCEECCEGLAQNHSLSFEVGHLAEQLAQLKAASWTTDKQVETQTMEASRLEAAIQTEQAKIEILRQAIETQKSKNRSLEKEAAKTPADYMMLKPVKVETVAERAHHLRQRCVDAWQTLSALREQIDADYVPKADFDLVQRSLVESQEEMHQLEIIDRNVTSHNVKVEAEIAQLFESLDIPAKHRKPIDSLIHDEPNEVCEFLEGDSQSGQMAQTLLEQLENGQLPLVNLSALQSLPPTWDFYIS